VGNWKREVNIKYFKENSFEALAQDFLERGYDFYIDGFTPKPIFGVNMIKEDEDINWMLETKSLQCRTIEFENYQEMISILEEMGKENYVFMYAIKPFQMRVAAVSSENKLVGINRKMRIREQKLNELLDSQKNNKNE
jgi:hypothetical protein